MEGIDIIAVHGDEVHKDHGGHDGVARALRSAEALRAALVAGLPVPAVLNLEGPLLITSLVDDASSGVNALERDAAGLLAEIGRFARRLHDLPAPDGVPVLWPDGVWVHGDLCPVNVLVTTGTAAIELAAVLDWEESRVDDPVLDLAWAEWLVRHLHPDRVGALGALYEGYGSTPSAVERRTAMARMLARHRERSAAAVVKVWTARLDQLGAMDLTLP